MKRNIIVLLILTITVFAGAQSLDRQLRNLAEEITRGYMEGVEDLLIKPRIGIGDFSEESDGAVNNSVGSLASALLTNEFSRSTVFSVIERKDLEAIMKEYSLSLSGLTSEETSPELGELQGVELLLLGSVSEAGEIYIISARLVEVETGKIVISSSIQVRRAEIEQESQLFLASTFQSPYGITLSPSVSLLMELGGNNNFFALSSIDAGYRVTKWLALSLGYAHITGREMNGLDTNKINVLTDETSPQSFEITRYFRFSGDGIKLAATVSTSPTTRLSLGGQLATVLYANAKLEQDLTDFPVWQMDTDGAVIIGNERIIVDGYTHDLYATYHISLSADYLISQRLSLFGKLGGFYLPEFIPIWFESAGSVRDNTIDSDSDIDRNGTFPQYQDFNFSRSSTGERIGFSALGVSVQLGIAINF